MSILDKEFFRMLNIATPNLDKLHNALCGSGLNSSVDDLPIVDRLPGLPPEHFIACKCSWCGEVITYDKPWDKDPNGETTDTICPSCMSQYVDKKSKGEVMIENVKNFNTPIEVVESYKGDR